MTADDIKQIRDLARAASPGPWRQGSVERHHVFVPDTASIGGMERVLLRMNDHSPFRPQFERDAAFIAAAHPTAIITLIDAFDDACRSRTMIAMKLDETSQKLDEATNLDVLDAQIIELRSVVGRVIDKLGYLARDYTGDKETRGLIERLKCIFPGVR